MLSDVAALVEPARTAVVVSEMQRGIVGDLARPPTVPMRDAVAQHGVREALARLCVGARACGARVVHATLQFRADRLGLRVNTPMLATMLRYPDFLVAGSEDAEIIPELTPRPGDLVAARLHGMSAFNGTELDPLLRAMDVSTLVIGGISLNEAVIGMAIEAVNIGYNVVTAADAVMGLPYEFGQDMLRYAFRPLGLVVPVGLVLDAWGVR